MNRAMKSLKKKDQSALLARERKRRRNGDWGEWETLTFAPGSAGRGWAAFITTAHRNKVFSVLDRQAEAGVRHLAVSSLSGQRPTWPEMQRIKDELAGPDATAIEVYPPRDQVVDEADMFHIWVLRGRLPFGLHLDTIPPAQPSQKSRRRQMSDNLIFKNVKPDNERDWPHYQGYWAVCFHCKSQFAGPKRAPSCWKCASEETKKWWIDKHEATDD